MTTWQECLRAVVLNFENVGHMLESDESHGPYPREINIKQNFA